jgi:predicted dehydrogenase
MDPNNVGRRDRRLRSVPAEAHGGDAGGDSALGVGIVGLSATGGFAARAHLPAIAAVDGLEVRALAASSAASARAAGEAYGINATFDSAEALAHHDGVDLVVIAVKVPMHDALVRAVLGAGKPILCEWPLGNGLGEAEALAAAAADRRTFIGLQGRSAPVFRYLRDLVADGYVGEVLSTSLLATVDQWGPTIASRGEWLLDRVNGARLLTIPFGHAIDTVTMVLGELGEVTATMATCRPEVTNTETGSTVAMTAEDQLAVTGTFTGGAVAALHYRGGGSAGTAGLRWEIQGTDGVLCVTGTSGYLQHGQVRLTGARGGSELIPVPLPPSYDVLPELAGSTARAVGHAYWQVQRDLREGTAVVPDFAHAVRRHQLLGAIERSATTGNRQAVKNRV